MRGAEKLLELSILKKRLRDTERAMEQIIADIKVGKTAKANGVDTKDIDRNASEMTQVR